VAREYWLSKLLPEVSAGIAENVQQLNLSRLGLQVRSIPTVVGPFSYSIFGSLTGALASTLSAWITQRHQDRQDILAKRLFHREQLYSDFISESARAMADAVQHDFQDPNKLTPTYALLSRIRLSSSTDVLASAEQVIQHIISTYSEPNLTPEKIHSRADKREDSLREFSNICRAELEAMQVQRR
jgi:hypothetical protein